MHCNHGDDDACAHWAVAPPARQPCKAAHAAQRPRPQVNVPGDLPASPGPMLSAAEAPAGEAADAPAPGLAATLAQPPIILSPGAPPLPLPAVVGSSAPPQTVTVVTSKTTHQDAQQQERPQQAGHPVAADAPGGPHRQLAPGAGEGEGASGVSPQARQYAEQVYP